MSDNLRGTGRTTRMLKKAIRRATGGQKVAVVGDSVRGAMMLFDTLTSIIVFGTVSRTIIHPRPTVWLKSGGSIEFFSRSACVQGYGFDSELWDHHAHECTSQEGRDALRRAMQAQRDPMDILGEQ